MTTNVVSTCFSSKQFTHGESFIRNVLKHSDDVVDKILIWNFDLGVMGKQLANRYDKVSITNFPYETYKLYPEYFGIPKQFAWVPAVWHFSRDYGDNILWMDTNKPPITSLSKVFEKIEKEEIFAGSGYGDREYIKNWAHNTCKEKMEVTDEIGEKRVIHAGTIGYKKNGKYDKIFKEAYEWSKYKDVIQGRKDKHARDQVVISILMAKEGYTPYKLTSNEDIRPIRRTYWEGRPHASEKILEILRLQ
jgi:hypothetical protein